MAPDFSLPERLCDPHVMDLLDQFDPSGTSSMAFKAAYDFGAKELVPLNADLDYTNEFPNDLWKKMGDQGFLVPRAPIEYGGAAMRFISQVAITAAISYHSGSVALSQLAHTDLCAGRILKWGSNKQKAEYLPGLADGTLVGALAMSEPNSGSDVGSMNTRAVKCDGGWKITGEKTWITNGGKADVMVLYAKTNDQKITAFTLAPKKTPGFNAEKKINKIGMRGSETHTLTFHECFVPDDAVLGQVDKGFHVLMDGLNTERTVLGGAATALAQASLDYTKSYASQRKQFSKPIGAFQSNAFDMAAAQSKIWTVQNSLYLYAHQYDQNPKNLTNAKAASVFLEAGEVARDVTQKCIELCGGMGYTKDLPLGQNKLDADLYLIGGGTMNIRKEVLARNILPVYAHYAEIERNTHKLNIA